MKKRTTKIGFIAIGVLYFTSYLILTLNGRYAATASGVIAGRPDGTLIIGPKFGYHWFVPIDYEFVMKGDLSPVGILYFPLIYLDRKLWHTREKAESLEYPVQEYFDHKTLESRDVK